MEKLSISDVYGKRIRIKARYVNEDEFLKAVKEGKVSGFSMSNKLTTKTIIPEGCEGTIAEGPYSSGCYNYDVEWPVQFNMFKYGVKGYSKDFTIGIPHEIIEFIK